MSPETQILGSLIRAWREEFGESETRARFALRIHASESSVSRWERGESVPTSKSLAILIDAIEPSQSDTRRAWRLWALAGLDPRARAHLEILPKGWERDVAKLLGPKLGLQAIGIRGLEEFLVKHTERP
jgi:transcriptional regulator with XRE-family HTH domain